MPVEIKLTHYLFSGSGAVGVEMIEFCEGGPGHAFPEPTVRLAGGKSEGYRAL